MMKRRLARPGKGYTLIELLIVMAIMGILFTVGYLSFQDYARRQTLLAAGRAVRVDIRTAIESAIAGNKPAACNNVLNGYQFWITSGTTYEIDAICSGGNVVVTQATVPTGITLTASNPNPVIFKVLAQGTNIPTGTTATVQVKQTLTGNIDTIRIGENGNVQ